MPERLRKQKTTEAFFVRQAALLLNECWELVPREAPDFEVTSATGQFGLEVTECQIGKKNKKGSEKRAQESGNLKSLEEVRQKYESNTGVLLNLKYLGPVNDRAMNELLKALLNSESIHSMDFFASSVCIVFPSGKAFVHRTTNPKWIVVRDRVGWVSVDGNFFQREIDNKALNLEDYRKAYSDVRLLVVSNRIYNSGKLVLEKDFRPDLKGFDAVYFFSYPDHLVPFFLNTD